MSKQTNIFTVYDGVGGAGAVVQPAGNGSAYTYIATGTAGQSATVEGSADGTVWVHVITLTIDEGQTTESDTKQHILPWLRISGTARLQICRGAA